MLDVIILAAGKGSRMKSQLPKVLHPIAGKPMVAHVIDTVAPLTDQPLNIVIGHGSDQVETALSNFSVQWVNQQQQLGTGHAVQQALSYLRSDAVALILYGDVPLIRQETLEYLARQASESSLGLLTVTLENPTGYGRIIRDNEGRAAAIVEQKDATAEQQQICEVNTGIMAVHVEHLQKWLPQLSNQNAQGEYYLTDIIAMAKEDSVQVNTHQPKDEWEVLGVNNRSQQAELERIYQANQAQQFMENGVTLLDPARFDCRGELTVGSDVVIDVNTIFEGSVSLGDGVSIGANCIIRNSIIEAGSEIKDNSIIEDSHLQARCIVGPFARLRPGTQLAEDAKIGNFVETKKATIGKGSKVNHLSYVGDAVLGDGVNIGAGTITCNYDGVNKHQTTIGDDVFVGSNTALVAPITLQKGATIGAGSTISRSVEEDTLALSRSPQRSVSDWQRPVKKK